MRRKEQKKKKKIICTHWRSPHTNSFIHWLELHQPPENSCMSWPSAHMLVRWTQPQFKLVHICFRRFAKLQGKKKQKQKKSIHGLQPDHSDFITGNQNTGRWSQTEREKRIRAVVCEWIDGHATCVLKARTRINRRTEYKRVDENVWRARVNLAPRKTSFHTEV